MIRKYNRIENIDEKIKSVSLPYFHWKVLFLVLEETGVQELSEILKSTEEEVLQVLDYLENDNLVELIEKEDEEKIEEIEPVSEVTEVQEEIVEEKTVEIESEPAEEIKMESKIEPVVEDSEEKTPQEVEEIEEETLEEIEGVMDAIQEDEDLKLEEGVSPETLLTSIEEEFEKEDLSAESVEDVEAIEEVEQEKEDESKVITSFIEELGETKVSGGMKEVKADLEEKKESELKKVKKKAAKGLKTVMVIDDSIVIRKMVKIALEDDDFNIISSNSGKEGLKLLDEENPHLVILDMMLPDMNGIDLLKTIKASKGVPVIMLSGKDAPQLVENAKNAGADDFLPKPFRDEDLVEKVKNLVK